MLNKTAAHPILQHDSDLKLFLESDAFSIDIKHKEHKEPGLGESKGMFSSMGFSVGGGGKFIEHDDVSRNPSSCDLEVTKGCRSGFMTEGSIWTL